ncbi:MAG: hypothetical protein Q4A43_04535 [Coriobacteriia bacterium]|nr:hypothetical protein [Coriobacteriia bacterium]
MSEKQDSIKELAASIVENPKLLDETVSNFEGNSRRNRQNAAAVLSQVSKIAPELLIPYIAAIEDALDRPEAQTRWESLDTLTNLVAVDSRACDKALQGAENALFDEDNGLVRLAAFRFICELGSTTNARSEKAWPLLDEAIQCYHGDYEYLDMLAALIQFAEGKISPSVKDALKERVFFDSENGHGPLQKRCKQIVDLLG